jgi:L-alanine-DL-glutamate epimerase-like enolase superfamily enzyme
VAQHLGLPLVEVLGRAHRELPTSITIGIKSVAETVAEGEEYVGRGFRVLKVKIGDALDVDLERLRALRSAIGPSVTIRVDANIGYTVEETARFFERTAPLAIEFVEQPVPREAFGEIRTLTPRARARIAADESLHDEKDALALAGPPGEPACGIYNIKLMKCGGIRPALRIAAIAETAGIALMWDAWTRAGSRSPPPCTRRSPRRPPDSSTSTAASIWPATSWTAGSRSTRA